MTLFPGIKQHCVMLKHNGRTELWICHVFFQNVIGIRVDRSCFPMLRKQAEFLKIIFSGIILCHTVSFIIEAQSFKISVLQG